MGKRKKRKRKSSNRIRLKKKFKSDPAFKDLEIIEASDGEKMSAVILRFVEPYKAHATSKEAYEKLIVLAMVAWNASILKGAAGQQIIDTVKETIGANGGETWSQELDQLLIELMVRKEIYFADNKRIVLDYHVTESKNEFNLSVISTP